MGVMLGRIFCRNSYIGDSYDYGLRDELHKQNKLKEKELQIKDLELKIKQYEKYSDEELLHKYNEIDPEKEFNVTYKIQGGRNNNISKSYESKDKVKNAQWYKDLQNEVIRRGLI